MARPDRNRLPTAAVSRFEVLHWARLVTLTVVPSVKGNGANSVFVNNAPAGTYYVAVDGRNGAVGTSNVTVGVGGP